MAAEASKGCSIHVGAPIRLTLSPAPKKVFELISACIMHPPCHEQKIRVEATALRPWRRPHFSPVHRENGPVFERTDSPVKLLELIRLRVPYFIRSLRFESSAATTSISAIGRWKFLQNTVLNGFSSPSPPKYDASTC